MRITPCSLSPMAPAQSDQSGWTLRWSSSSVCSRCWCGPRRPCCRCCRSDGCKRAQRPWKDDSASSCTPAGSSLGREHLAWKTRKICEWTTGIQCRQWAPKLPVTWRHVIFPNQKQHQVLNAAACAIKAEWEICCHTAATHLHNPHTCINIHQLSHMWPQASHEKSVVTQPIWKK